MSLTIFLSGVIFIAAKSPFTHNGLSRLLCAILFQPKNKRKGNEGIKESGGQCEEK
jgi:hypothetical protein